jgi:hypothetical protein
MSQTTILSFLESLKSKNIGRLKIKLKIISVELLMRNSIFYIFFINLSSTIQFKKLKEQKSKGGGISCSYASFLSCEAIFRGRDLFFFVEALFFFQFGQLGACSRTSSSRIGGKNA